MIEVELETWQVEELLNEKAVLIEMQQEEIFLDARNVNVDEVYNND